MPRESSHFTRHEPPAHSRSYSQRYSRSYTHPPRYYDAYPTSVNVSDPRKDSIPDRREYDLYENSFQNSPKPVMNFLLTEESELEKQKAITHSVMKSLATFMVQAKHNDNDLNLLRDALKEIVGDKNDVSNDQLGLLAKRIETCEKHIPDVSVMERLTSLERRLGEETAMIHGRLERLENKLLHKVSVENSNDIKNTLSKKLDIESKPTSRKKKAESNSMSEKEENVSRKQPRVQPISDIFSVPSIDLATSSRNTFLCGQSCASNTPQANSSPILGEKNVESRLANVASTLSSDLVLERLKNLENQLTAVTEKLSSSINEDECEQNTEGDVEIKVEENAPLSLNAGQQTQFILDSDDYVIIHIDGVGSIKPNESAKPGIRVWFGESHALNVSRPVESGTSTKSALLLALYAALSQSSQAGLLKVRLYTSSDYIIRCSRNFDKWNNRQWMTSDMNPNIRLKHANHFKAIFNILLSLRTDFRRINEENHARSMALTLNEIKEEPL